MNFYRVGKVIGLTANQGFTFDQSAFTHKAVMIPNGSFGSTPLLTVYFHDAATTTPLGITFVPQATSAGQCPYIIPGVLKAINSTVAGRIVLLG